jgi:hypothetical protein
MLMPQKDKIRTGRHEVNRINYLLTTSQLLSCYSYGHNEVTEENVSTIFCLPGFVSS